MQRIADPLSCEVQKRIESMSINFWMEMEDDKVFRKNCIVNYCCHLPCSCHLIVSMTVCDQPSDGFGDCVRPCCSERSALTLCCCSERRALTLTVLLLQRAQCADAVLLLQRRAPADLPARGAGHQQTAGHRSFRQPVLYCPSPR